MDDLAPRVVANGAYAIFEGMTWPLPAERMGDLEWKLRYANEALTREDLLYAASVINGYRQLIVHDTQKIRNGKIQQIRRALSALEQSSTGETK